MGAQFGLIATMLLGQRIVGGVVSGRTVTVKQQMPPEPVVPAGLLVQQTCVTPSGKLLPEGGEQVSGSSAPVQVLEA